MGGGEGWTTGLGWPGLVNEEGQFRPPRILDLVGLTTPAGQGPQQVVYTPCFVAGTGGSGSWSVCIPVLCFLFVASSSDVPRQLARVRVLGCSTTDG